VTGIQDILQAIADALVYSHRQLVMIVVTIAGIVVLAVLGAWIPRIVSRRRANAALQKRFDREVRRVDLTVRQLDVLTELSKHLYDSAKKYLLLLNRNTFMSCLQAAGRLPAPLAADLPGLKAKLGFTQPLEGSLELSRFQPSVGASVRLRSIRSPGTALAAVVSHAGNRMTLRIERDAGLRSHDTVQIVASHPSGLVAAEGELGVIDRSEVVCTITRGFSEADNLRLSDESLRVFVRHEGRETKTEEAEIRSIWATGALLWCDNLKISRRDDLQIVLRRNHQKWVVVNAEATSVRRGGRLVRLRFSHLSADARREILGRTAP